MTTIIIPTRQRQAYLPSTIAGVVAQVRALDQAVEVIVVDDEPSAQTAAIAQQFGVQYVAHAQSQGPNAARNSAIAASHGELLIFLDDDVEVGANWLMNFLQAADKYPTTDVFAGRILPRIEGYSQQSCNQEDPPVTTLDLGNKNQETTYGWSANLAIRRTAFHRAGMFDAKLPIYGDEEEWQDRHLASGGKTLYVANAVVYHRRSGRDATLRSLTRAAYHRGKAAQRYDRLKQRAPSHMQEAKTVLGCFSHTLHYRCKNGIPMSAHSIGRLYNSYLPQMANTSEADFLSGESGTVGGKRRLLRRLTDNYLDVKSYNRRTQILSRARQSTKRNILVLGIEREGMLMEQIRSELKRSDHNVDIFTCGVHGHGKFENLNQLLSQHPVDKYDWLLVVDDDIELTKGFLDGFIYLCEQTALRIAQPAHKLDSHAAWQITRRDPHAAVRATHFVEIGPLTAFHRYTFDTLLPFPALKMGWGLDCHWSAVAQEHSWRIGVVDLFPIAHRLAPAGASYNRETVIAEAAAFLKDRPYVTREEAKWSQQLLR